jgi:hypothetical protein
MSPTASGGYYVVTGGAGWARASDIEVLKPLQAEAHATPEPPTARTRALPTSSLSPIRDEDEATEQKETKDPVYEIPSTPSLRTYTRGLFGRKSHVFKMVALTTVGADGSGVMRQALPISPSVASYAEWSSLSSLFDEVRLVSSTLLLRTQVGGNNRNCNTAVSDLIINDVYCGFDCENISTAPASFAAVVRLEGSKPIQRSTTDTSGSSRFMSHGRPPWARVAVPAVQDPPAGLLGSFSIANAAALSVSTIYYYATLHTTVELRCRI